MLNHYLPTLRQQKLLVVGSIKQDIMGELQLQSFLNIDKRKKMCLGNQKWPTAQWNNGLFFDVSSFTLFLIQHESKSGYSSKKYLALTVWDHYCEAWGCFWDDLDFHIMGFFNPFVVIHDRGNVMDNQIVLADHVYYGTLFPCGSAIFLGNNAPIHTINVFESWYEERRREVDQLDWLPQVRNLNIIVDFVAASEKRLLSDTDAERVKAGFTGRLVQNSFNTG